VRATGRSIGEWQRRAPAPAPLRFATLLIMPPREVLYAACDRRFATMIAEGALDEATRLAARALPSDLPAMKGVGVPELLRHLRGEISYEDDIAISHRDTHSCA